MALAGAPPPPASAREPLRRAGDAVTFEALRALGEGMAAGDAASQVDISVKFLLTGALAQFSRSGLVKDVAHHLTAVFANNLEASLSGRSVSDGGGATLDVGSVTRAALWQRIRGFFAKLIGK